MKIEGVSSRDVLIQSEDLTEAAQFYETVLGLRVTHRSETLIGLETGSFCLYVEKGPSYGPVFEFYVSDLAAAKSKLIGAGCRVVGARRVGQERIVAGCAVVDPRRVGVQRSVAACGVFRARGVGLQCAGSCGRVAGARRIGIERGITQSGIAVARRVGGERHRSDGSIVGASRILKECLVPSGGVIP